MNNPLLVIANICLIIGGLSALIIAIDLLAGHKQHMWIMNLVWPITALYAGPLALWGYFTAGRLSTHRAMEEAWPISSRSGCSSSFLSRFSG